MEWWNTGKEEYWKGGIMERRNNGKEE